MTAPQVAAEVRYLCPTCSGEGAFWSRRDHDMRTCDGCEGHRTVDADRARELHARGMTDQRDTVPMSVYTRRLREEHARQFDPDEDDAQDEARARAERLAAAKAALRSKLKAARAVQADFERRHVPLSWPVALTIDEAEALAVATGALE